MFIIIVYYFVIIYKCLQLSSYVKKVVSMFINDFKGKIGIALAKSLATEFFTKLLGQVKARSLVCSNKRCTRATRINKCLN